MTIILLCSIYENKEVRKQYFLHMIYVPWLNINSVYIEWRQEYNSIIMTNLNALKDNDLSDAAKNITGNSFYNLINLDTCVYMSWNPCHLIPDTDPCDPDPCAHGSCTRVGNGYICKCYSGYSGSTCSGSFIDNQALNKRYWHLQIICMQLCWIRQRMYGRTNSYNQTCIKKSHLRKIKRGPSRQVTYYMRFNSYEIVCNGTRKCNSRFGQRECDLLRQVTY